MTGVYNDTNVIVCNDGNVVSADENITSYTTRCNKWGQWTVTDACIGKADYYK